MRRTSRVRLAVVGCLVALAGGALGAASAAGASSPALTDCNAHNGALTHSYSITQLRQALATMSPATKEYTSCPDEINKALAAALSTAKTGGTAAGTGTGGSGSFLPTPVIVILVVLVLTAITFGAIAVRRRRDADDDGGLG